MVENGWLPRHKVAEWISVGLLDVSFPLRVRVVAFRCVREVFGHDDRQMAEVAMAIDRANTRRQGGQPQHGGR